MSTTGGAGAFLLGVNPIWGFVAMGLAATSAMEMIGVQRARGRDVATGIVLGGVLGLAALFLYLGTTESNTTGASITVLFGSIFVIDHSTAVAAALCGVVVLAMILPCYRMLLLSSLNADLASSRGVPVRLVGICYLAATSVAVALAAITIGAVLSTALLIGPAATALRLTTRPGARHADCLPHRHRCDVARDRARLRQLCLAAGGSRLAGELLRGRADLRRLRVVRLHDPHPPPVTHEGRVRKPPLVFSTFMTDTWIAASLVAVIAGVVGFFAVLRGSAFAAHAVPQGAFAGAAGASLIGANTLLGLGVFAVLGALGIGWLGRRGRHDVATALSLVVLLGLGALFLSMSVEYAPEIYSLLFGEVLGVSAAQLVPLAVLGVVCIAAIGVLYRPLLLSSVLGDVAEASGVSSARMELCFLVIVAIATTMTVPVVGAFLMFSLMIAPAASARLLTASPARAMGLSVCLALAIVWVAVAASYVSQWPVGFFVGTLGVVTYATTRAGTAVVRRRGQWRRCKVAEVTTAASQ